MGDELHTFAVINVGEADLGATDLEACHAGETIQMISVEGIDPSSLINQEGDLTSHALEIQQLESTETGEEILDTNQELETQQLVTIDGKQLFLLTADGTLAAVTADVLQKGAITLSDAITVGPEIGVEEYGVVEPAMKRVKIEDEALPEVTAATLNVQHGFVYFATDDQEELKDDAHKAHRAVPPKVVTTPRVVPSHSLQQPRGDGEMDVTQAWFTTKDDKQSLQGKGHSWKQGQWTKDEVEVLQNNISQYCGDHSLNDPTEVIFEMSKDERKDFYRTVARGLNRPLFSVYRRVIRMYDQKNHIGKYTPEEIAKLKELRARYLNDWAKIGAALGRSASSVKDKCRLMRDMCNSGKWLPEEEQRLAEAVYSLSGVKPGENVTTGLSWAAVSERVVTRSEKQCRTKWLNYLNWKQQGGSEWTRIDDLMLIEKIDSTGAADETQVDWNDIAENWSSVRSPQWLRGKWWTMKRHVPDYSMLSFPDLVKCVRTLHTHNLRTTVPVTTSKSQNKAAVKMDGLQLVPVTDGAGNIIATGEESALISYEVLQGLQNTHHQHGALLITQPHNNPAITIANGNFTSDHIIVHTLPIGQVPGTERVLQLNAESQLVMDSATVATADSGGKTNLSTIQLAAATPITVQGTVDDIEIQQQLAQVASSVICNGGVSAEEVINLNTDAFHIQNTEGDEVSQSSADGATAIAAAAASDMVMARDSPQTFVRSSSHDGELIHMSSLSDPMLPSDGTDLIGCSDIEGEKNQVSDSAS